LCFTNFQVKTDFVYLVGAQLKAMETLLADALRREKLLEKTTDAKIEYLTRMVSCYLTHIGPHVFFGSFEEHICGFLLIQENIY